MSDTRAAGARSKGTRSRMGIALRLTATRGGHPDYEAAIVLLAVLQEVQHSGALNSAGSPTVIIQSEVHDPIFDATGIGYKSSSKAIVRMIDKGILEAKAPLMVFEDGITRRCLSVWPLEACLAEFDIATQVKVLPTGSREGA